MVLGLGAGQRGAVGAQGPDRVDDELGLAVAARADHRHVEDRGDGLVEVGLGQGRQAADPQGPGRLGRKDRTSCHDHPGATARGRG
ncbi:MAG: hypothetical protein H6709_22905 [Kofleriaceae bacterium]|nr:hypothetical protein [Kofleriaceae bacterium]